MKKTFVFNRSTGRMEELQRDSVPLYRGDALDQTSVDVATPRGLKAMENDDRYRNMSKRQLAAAMGFDSLEVVKRTWNHLLCFVLLLVAVTAHSQTPPYISPGFTFTNGQLVTAAQLNALVANASIGYQFYSTSTGETILGNGDKFLVLTTGNQFRLISAANAILNNTNQYANAAQETNATTNAFVLIWDGGATGQIFKFAATNWPAAALMLQPQTNWDNAVIFASYDTNTGVSYSYSWPYIGSNWNKWLSLTNSSANSSNSISTNGLPNDGDLFITYNSTNSSNQVTTWQNLKYGVTNGAVQGDSKNLVIFTTGRQPAATLTVTADEVVLKHTNGLGASYLIRNLSQIMDPTLTTPTTPWGGFDTNFPGTLFPTNTWLYVWALSDGTNSGCVFSTNYGAPIYPSNVCFSARISALFTGPQAADNGLLPGFYQIGNACSIVPKTLLDGLVQSNSYTALWATNADLTYTNQITNFNRMVPPIAKTATGLAGISDTAKDCSFFISPSGALAWDGSLVSINAGETFIRGVHCSQIWNGFTFCEPFTVAIATNSSLFGLVPGQAYFLWTSQSAAVTNHVVITGYSL